jgi:N-acetylglucosamine transport system permease protein
VDDASHSRTFFQIMLPMARPGLISVGIFFAGLVMAMVPVLAAYIVFQRQVVQGLTAGALK